MSLYNDLTDVLTPYANKIKEVNESLDDKVDYGTIVINPDTVGMVRNNGKVDPAATSWHCIYTEAIPCKPGWEFTCTVTCYNSSTNVVFFLLDGVAVSQLTKAQADGQTIVVPDGVNQVVFAANNNNGGSIALAVQRLKPLPYDSISDMQIPARLEMVTSLREVEEERTIVDGMQLVNPNKIVWTPVGSAYRGYIHKIKLCGNGEYYPNPYNNGSAGGTQGYSSWNNISFYDKYGERLVLNEGGTEVTTISTMLHTNGAKFVIENNRTLKTYINDSLHRAFTADADIGYIGTESTYIWYPSAAQKEAGIGLTYGIPVNSYAEYTGEDTDSIYEYDYTTGMARFVQDWIGAHEKYDNNLYNFTYPERDNSEFMNVVKYYTERSKRKEEGVIRIGTFNKFVSRGKSNWEVIKQELADYSLDICGFQECAAIVTDGVVSDQIGQALQGWQFKSYAPQDTVVDKALVSHWNITHTDLITLLTHDGGTVSNCIHALMTISQNKYYSHAVGADATLSVYCYHGASSGKTISGTSYSSYQVRQMEINALLAILAQDTSDFIVIVGDTNAFENGFDIATGTHHEWEMFRNAGFTPVLEGKESTVTADLQNKYFCKADNDKVYCIACYDQIFIGANITAETYGVVDSNLYPVESLGGVPVSDHCMVYADLKFDFDAVAQSKLVDIAVTTPWW